MKDVNHLFIINPKAGKYKAAEIKKIIIEQCEKLKLFYRVEIISDIEYAKNQANEFACEHEDGIVYSVGGDGTLNVIINGIALTNASLGVIPTGSGNDFFRMLCDDRKSITDVTSRTIDGDIEKIDLGIVNGRYFLNSATVGYSAYTAYNAELMKKSKIIPRDLIYLASILYTFLSYKSPYVNIELNGKTIEQKITLLDVCNGRYYGNGIPIAPKASITDGLFDVYLADDISKRQIPTILSSLLKGEHEKYACVHKYQTDYIKIEAEKLLPCNVDGEIITAQDFEIALIKGKVKVLRPKKTTV
ncbi:MAG: diacylglycerol kinase family protein [Bacilli bacterium]|jgi:YegS/Rv2252/BmrU family lipid kinase